MEQAGLQAHGSSVCRRDGARWYMASVSRKKRGLGGVMRGRGEQSGAAKGASRDGAARGSGGGALAGLQQLRITRCTDGLGRALHPARARLPP